MNTDVPMSKIYESDIEQMAIEQLQAIGYRHVYGIDIEPSGIKPLRAYSQVLLQDNVLQAIATINPQLTPEQCLEAYQRISQHNQLTIPNNVSNNLAFHRLLTEGIPLEIHKDGNSQGEQVWLIDWNEPSNNEFLVINQLTITHDSPKGKYKRRPDLILYINGIPLVVIELKNATDANATIQGAYNQIQTYQDQIPQLFTYNAFCVVSDGLEAKAGTLSADFSRYMTWKTKTGDTEAHRHEPQLNVLIQGLLNPVTLLDMVRHFIVFEASKTEDKNGIITISNIKKMAAYHQYYAVNKAVLSTIRASSENSDEDDTPEDNLSNKKAGVVWHTQGSGKSLSMVFYTGKIVLAMNNPTVVILTDRNDLDDQLFATFSASVQLLRQSPKQAGDREQLKELLKVNSGGVIFTTIQKFQPEDGSNVYDTLSERHNIIVIADEAHRSQYGFAAKEVDVKNDAGDVTGKRTVYGFAKYLRDALPNATYLGFTGTPIEKNDVNTPAVFGDYVDIYDISQAVEDGATVRIFYESRLAKVAISDEGKKLIADFDEEFNEDELTATQQARAKWVKAEALIGSHDRIQAVKACLAKFDENSPNPIGISDTELETRVRQTIDQALVSEKVVDIFDAAGIQKPDISILSDEFMEEMRDYEHKNIALETLKKLLNDEIKVREQHSVTQGKKLMEMLNNAIKGYQNKVLTAAEVIEELIKLAKEIKLSDNLANELKLTNFEYAFYSAVAENDSAKELMGKDKLRELAIVLTSTIRNNISVDWTIKESARAKIRTVVKRLLRKYGYPPDMELLATELVLHQAEVIADQLVS